MKVFVENPAGTNIKNIYNEQTFEFIKSKPYAAVVPFAYGFIVGTVSGDGDCLDCFVMTDRKLKSGEFVDCESTKLIEYFEDQELDHKIIMRPVGENRELSNNELGEIVEFLLHVFDNVPEKRVRVGRVLGIEEANELIRKSQFRRKMDKAA